MNQAGTVGWSGRRRRGAWAAGLAAALALAGCSGDDDGAVVPSSTSAPDATGTTGPTPAVGVVPSGANPQPSGRAAVEVLLRAEVDGRYDGSFAVLSSEGRAEYPDLDDWVARQAELPRAIAFEVEEETTSAVVVAVENEPGLDPFRGLSPAHERQTWTVRSTPQGWLVDAEPVVELVLPADAEAVDVARRWAEAVQRCDQAAGSALEAATPLLGSSTRAGALCGTTGAVVDGGLVALPPGSAQAELIAQYSADVELWARAVAITAPVRFTVVLAPIGPSWRVLAVTDA